MVAGRLQRRYRHKTPVQSQTRTRRTQAVTNQDRNLMYCFIACLLFQNGGHAQIYLQSSSPGLNLSKP
jgi:hypothetical protein